LKLSRWGIFLIDLGIVVFSLAVAHLLRFNFELEQIEYAFLPWGGVVLIGLRVLSFAVFRIYSGIIYYTGLEDAKRIFYALASGSLLMGLLFNPILYGITDQYLLPYSITIIEFSLSIFLMTAYRGLVKILYMELTNARKESKKVVIYGAGEGGVTVKQVLERDAGANYSVSAFIDDNEDLQKKRILGIEIFPGERLERLLLTTQPDILIFSTLDISAERRQEVIEQCLKNGVKVLNVPPVDKWINGELSFRQIRQIRIEDLLERDVIQLDKAGLEKQLTGKVILITGAAGSIGSELARQVIRFQPKQLVLLDQAETPSA
jgi:FlaA1/EpsC-like NDP-sugar epimerase